MKILLVDDSKIMRNIQQRVLTALGETQFSEANDGAEAMNLTRSNQYDLILADWNMPNMDGITFLRNFRTTDKKTPLIMVTTEVEKSRVLDAIKAGANNYVVKPFTPETLMDKVKQTLAKSAAPAAA